MNSIIFILTLQDIPGIGYKSTQNILSSVEIDSINNSEDIVEAIKKSKHKFNSLSIPDLGIVKKALNNANRIYEESSALDIKIISIFDNDYPKQLKQITNPPLLLHAKGNIEALNDKCIALIGTRKPTDYGFKQAKNLGFQFVKQGINVVSGLALGIDTSAHNGALKANGNTIAVLAHGLDSISPKSNIKLAEEIILKKGLLLSEYPIGTKAKRHAYIERNRIQSGLSLGTVLVESKIKGGSMKTVEFCKEQNRLLGVVKPPEELMDNKQFQGNIYLMSNSNVELIDGDITKFYDKIISPTPKKFKKTTLDWFS